ncbi:MAG: sulfatase [Polyangiaceae bacterium]
MLLGWLLTCGSLLGILGLWVAGQPWSPGAALAAAAYGAVAGLLAGVPLQTLQSGLRRIQRVRRLMDGASNVEDDPSPRSARRRAWSLVVVLATVGVLASGLLAKRAVARIQNEELAGDLTLLVTATTVVSAIALAPALVGVISRALERVQLRVSSRWTADRELGIPLAAVLSAGIVWLCRRQYDSLTSLIPVLAVLLLLLAALPMFLPPRRFVSTKQRRVAVAFMTGLALLVTLAGLTARSRSTMAALADSTVMARVSRPFLLLLGDVDRDGASAWLGGGDCAPFDPKISPRAFDVPGNQIDEDCDGKDAESQAAVDRPKPLYSPSKLPKAAKNVIWVVVDAMRMDHTSLVPGYKHRSTPNLEKLAKESLLFTHALSQSSATLLSMPSMLLGRNPDQIDWVYNKRHSPLPGYRGLPQLLKPFGYHSAVVLNTYIIDNYDGITRGFDQKLDAWRGKGSRPWREGTSGSAISHGIEYIEDRLRAPQQQPFFLMLYFDDPHAAYVGHPGFEFGKSAKQLHISEVAQSDARLGMFLEYLRTRDRLWADSIVIVTADHGEEFGEHGGRYHAYSCHIESVHVPLLVRIPGVADKGKVVDSPVGLIDVLPTILEAIGHPEDEELDGQSLLVPALHPELTKPRNFRCATVSQRAGFDPFDRRALRTPSLALFEDRTKGTYELYDIEHDPLEKKPVSMPDKQQQLIDYARRTTTSNLADHTKF